MVVTRYSDVFGLGRIDSPVDVNDLRYLMGAHPQFPTDEPTRGFIMYTIGPLLDQGQTYPCCGFANRALLSASPNRYNPFLPLTPLDISRWSQAVDGFPLPHNGTTMRAAAKVMQERGYWSNYLWARSAQDMRRFMLAGLGPVLVGTKWYSRMFEPVNGIAKPQGTDEGGHAYFCFGYVRKYRMFRFQNSWGKKWGQGGRFWMHEDDVDLLLADGGEAVAPTEIPVAPLPLSLPDSIVRPTQLVGVA
jgi:hypothetical protein